jgi:hypothetical protein
VSNGYGHAAVPDSEFPVINPNSSTDAGRELGPDPRERFEVAGIDGVALLE